jgi:hypothetical protein
LFSPIEEEEKVAMASIGNLEVGDVQEEGDVEEEVARIPLEEGLPPQEGAASRPGRSFLYYIGALVAAVVALSVALAVVVSTDDDATVLVEQTAGEGGDRVFLDSVEGNDRMVEGNGLAEVPEALVDFLADVVALPEGADGRRRLAIPPDMLSKLKGKCGSLDEYTASQNTNAWQCAQKELNPNYALGLNPEIGSPYEPSDNVLELLANATGASLSSLQSMRIGSGQPLAPEGSWCGMPAPGAEDLEKGNLSGQDKLAYDYWLKCVMPRAGYFNVLQCAGQCDEDEKDCSTYAVLGYAAMDPNVCYPAHQHMNEEAYWQIGGRGWWRTWNNVTGLDNHTTASNDNFGGSKYALHPHRSGVPHEFDTTNNFDGDGGAGTLEEPMIMVYWWGIDNSVSIDYQWADQVRDNTYKYEESAQSCGDFRRIPEYNENLTQTITNQNC